MKKSSKAAAAAPSTAILLAVGELQGGGVTVPAGGELTDELRAEIGLDDEEVASLIERGHLIASTARVAGADGGAELAAALVRAEAAEAEVEELKAALDAATKPAAKSPAAPSAPAQ